MTQEQQVNLNGDMVTLKVLRNPRAKRVSVRIDAAQAQAVLVLPKRTSLQRGLDFVKEHQNWIKGRLDALPKAVPFTPGKIIPFQGKPHLLVHQPHSTDAPRRAGQTIVSGGREDFFPRRIETFLKEQAKQEINARIAVHGAALSLMPTRVTIKDPKTRWGSCTPKRELNFSWRLIFAPPAVLDYLVAHECAHMRHLNHSRQFWDQVGHLCPDYDRHRKWLDANGPALHAFGR